MSIEETIAAAVQSQVSPLLAEMRRMNTELEALRRALPPQLVTLTEAARRLGISMATARRRVKDGTVPCRRIGRSVRVDLSALNSPTNAEVNAGVVALRDFRRHTSKDTREANGGT
jgi:excisionase family DNA binding protein